MTHHWRTYRASFCRAAGRAVFGLLATGAVLARPIPQPEIVTAAPPIVITQLGGAQIAPGSTVTLQSAVETALKERPGRVIRAVTVELSGRRIHEIRILLDEGGRVVTVRIDAQSGETL